MDTRDLLILGGLGLAGWCAYRWWKRQPAANQAEAPKDAIAGAAASQMTGAAARTTVFGGGMMTRNLLSFPSYARLTPKAPSTAVAPPESDWEMLTNPIQRGFVLNAILGPLPVAPSPNNNRYASPDGGLVGEGTAPIGSPPDPGDPSPTFTNPLMYSRGLL